MQLFLFDFDLPRNKNKSFQNLNRISHLNAYVIPSESRGYPTASVH